jgi:hypothetical protein
VNIDLLSRQKRNRYYKNHRRNFSGGGGGKGRKCHPKIFSGKEIFWLWNWVLANKKYTEKRKWKTWVLWDQFSPLSNLTHLKNKVPNTHSQFCHPPPPRVTGQVTLMTNTTVDLKAIWHPMNGICLLGNLVKIDIMLNFYSFIFDYNYVTCHKEGALCCGVTY